MVRRELLIVSVGREIAFFLKSTWHNLGQPRKEVFMRDCLDYVGLWAYQWGLYWLCQLKWEDLPPLGGTIP